MIYYYPVNHQRVNILYANSTSGEQSCSVPAFEQGLRLIELLRRSPDGLSIPEIEYLEIPAASLFRMLSTLITNGYAVR